MFPTKREASLWEHCLPEYTEKSLLAGFMQCL